MEFRSQLVDDILVMTIILSKATSKIAQTLKSKLFDEIDNGNALIVLNLRNVDFTDSSFMGALLAVRKTAIENSGAVVLCELKPQVKKVFEVTYMDRIFGIFETVDKAIQNLKNNGG